MITLTAADGSVRTMSEAEFLASRPSKKTKHPRETAILFHAKPPYTPQGDGVSARWT